MRKKLLNYSLETDQLVWLEFSDGRNLRVAFDQVGDHLTGPDLVKVQRAIKLRQDFFRQNLPGTMVLLAVVGLSVFIGMDYKNLSGIVSGGRPVASPPVEKSAPAQVIQTTSPSPAPPESVSPAAASVPSAAPESKPVHPATPVTAVPAVPAAPSAPTLQAPQLPPAVSQALENLTSKLPKL
jgi:hypothetical protein